MTELGAFIVDGSNLVTIHVDTEFLYHVNMVGVDVFDGSIIVDFAPVFDRFLQALPITD